MLAFRSELARADSERKLHMKYPGQIIPRMLALRFESTRRVPIWKDNEDSKREHDSLQGIVV